MRMRAATLPIQRKPSRPSCIVDLSRAAAWINHRPPPRSLQSTVSPRTTGLKLKGKIPFAPSDSVLSLLPRHSSTPAIAKSIAVLELPTSSCEHYRPYEHSTPSPQNRIRRARYSLVTGREPSCERFAQQTPIPSVYDRRISQVNRGLKLFRHGRLQWATRP